MSQMHKEADEWEATCLSAERNGGMVSLKCSGCAA